MKTTIRTAADKTKLQAAIANLPIDVPHTVTIEPQKDTRSAEQNRRLWAMLGDVSRQVEWYGQHLSGEEWKDVFTAALKRLKVVPGLDGGFVVIGGHTSKMTIAEMTEMIELMFSFGAEHKVAWTDPTFPQEP